MIEFIKYLADCIWKTIASYASYGTYYGDMRWQDYLVGLVGIAVAVLGTAAMGAYIFVFAARTIAWAKGDKWKRPAINQDAARPQGVGEDEGASDKPH